MQEAAYAARSVLSPRSRPLYVALLLAIVAIGAIVTASIPNESRLVAVIIILISMTVVTLASILLRRPD
jgi:hypothetical protein